MQIFPIRVQVCVLAALHLIQFPANVPEKAVEDSLGVWASAPQMGDLGGVLGCWLQPGPSLAQLSHCGYVGVNLWIRNIGIHLSLGFCFITLPFK